MASLTAQSIDELARVLEGAALESRAVPKVTIDEPQLSLADAYDVQWALRRRRLRAGSRVAGLKMGLTSLAKMKQMGVETPIYGFLLDDYRVAADSELSIAGLIHPRVEAEIALVTRHALRGGLLPVVSFSGPALAFLVTGTVVVEKVFALPGLGNYFINACLNRDEPLIIGIVAFIAVTVLVFNLLVDISYALIDPRIRY